MDRGPAGVIGLFGTSNLQTPTNWVDFAEKQCRRLLKELFAAEGKDICTPGTWGSKVRLVTDFKAGWGDTSPCTPEAVLDGLGFP